MKVFLTGASSGLGAALARRYVGDGATLGLVARREGELARLAEALAPATLATYACDVRDSEALATDEVISRVRAKLEVWRGMRR